MLEIRKNRGMMLVEVMVASAVLAVIALGLASVMQMGLKGQKTVESDTGVTNLTEGIRGVLGSVDACLNTFGGMTYTGAPISITKIMSADTPPTPIFQVFNAASNNVYEARTLKITSMTLEPAPLLGNTPVITINYDKFSESYGPQSKTRQIPMALTLDASKKIIACVALAKMTDEIWTRIPNTNWDIEYTGGKVGVGTFGKVLGMLDVAHTSGASTDFYIRSAGTSAVDQAQIDLVTKDGGAGLESGSSLGWSIAAKGDQYSVANAAPANSLATSYWDGAKWTPVLVALKDGSVGVGTAAPQTQLHLLGASSGAGGVAIGIENTQSNGPSFLALKTNYNNGIPFRGMVAKPQSATLSANSNNDWFIGNWGTPARSISFLSSDSTYTNFVERMRLDDQGRIALGNITSIAGLLSGVWNASPGSIAASFPNNYYFGLGQAPDNGSMVTGLFLGANGAPRAANFIYDTPGRQDYVIKTYGNSGIRFQRGNFPGPGGTEVMTFHGTTDNVGIRNMNPAYPLDVNGDVRVSGNVTVTGTVTASSDERLKKDFEPITGALEKVLKLNGLYFKWKKPELSPDKQVGFKAQEVEKVIPEVVSKNAEGYKTVAYGNISAVLVEAIKDQQKILKQLQAENAELKEVICNDHPKAKICVHRQAK